MKITNLVLELQLTDLEENDELERNLRLRLNIPTETKVVQYQFPEPDQQLEEQDDPLDLKIPRSQEELDPGVKSPEECYVDLSQMLPVDAIIEVINEGSDASTVYPGLFPKLDIRLFLTLSSDSCHSESSEESSPGSFSEASSRSPSSSSSSPPPGTLAVSSV